MTRLAQIFLPVAIVVTTSGASISAAVATPAQAAELADSGSFRGADSSHPASGRAEIVRLRNGGLGVKLHADFRVRGGPDLRIWISEAGNPRSARAVRAAGHVDLGRLRSSNGEQIYRIPADVDVNAIGSVVIWCRAFSVFFGSAALN